MHMLLRVIEAVSHAQLTEQACQRQACTMDSTSTQLPAPNLFDACPQLSAASWLACGTVDRCRYQVQICQTNLSPPVVRIGQYNA